jgi:hypothetical protein
VQLPDDKMDHAVLQVNYYMSCLAFFIRLRWYVHRRSTTQAILVLHQHSTSVRTLCLSNMTYLRCWLGNAVLYGMFVFCLAMCCLHEWWMISDFWVLGVTFLLFWAGHFLVGIKILLGRTVIGLHMNNCSSW